MSHDSPLPRSPQAVARLAGLLYLLQMAAGIFGFWAHGSLTVRGDVAATARNIAASETLYRLGTASDLVVTVLVIVLSWALYLLLASVDRNLALLALLLRVAENAIAAAALFTDYLGLRLLGDSAYAAAFAEEQRQALARVLFGGQGAGLQVAFVFVGLATAVYAWLWLRSRYVPRALAWLGLVGGPLLAGCTLAILVWPGLAARLRMAYMAPIGLFEVGLGLWLLVRGVRVPPAPPAAPLRAG